MSELDRPLIVIGAGRSGTTMIREALMQHPDVAGFEYEMNYLWRTGNRDLVHDMLDPDQHLKDATRDEIRAAFAAESARQQRPRVLDKTVANVMRPRFVQAVLPEARILHVIRDGRAVAASAMERWAAPQPARYYAAKARTVPLGDLPAYGLRYVKNRVLGLLRKRPYRQSWGPRWPGIDADVRELELARVCARQWRLSVATARGQAGELAPGSYKEVRYEELVADPTAGFDAIRRFFELPPDTGYDRWVAAEIDGDRRDRWRERLDPRALAAIEEEAAAELAELGYA